MNKQYRYSKKNVHDIPVEKSFVRVWDAGGTVDSKLIMKNFQPLLKAGFIYPYIALMPDYHPGEGSMIGSIVPTRDVVLLSVCGGDLGCGMTAVRLPIGVEEIEYALQEINRELKAGIPVGTAYNSILHDRVVDNPIWGHKVRLDVITNSLRKKLMRQLGSLGGGNHFIEIQSDEEGMVWVMLHSGSRYLGVIIRDYYVGKGEGQKDIDTKIYAKFPYLLRDTKLAEDYLADLQFAVGFARESRKEMMMRVLEVFSRNSSKVRDTGTASLINNAHDCVHNYVSREKHFGEELFVHRKGAIHLENGEIGLIPGSMGTSSYVVEGRNNEYSFSSCSHGAGRAMSRGEAFKKVSGKVLKKSMSNVIFDYSDRIRDEAPVAYKDIHDVMRSQKDLVKIRHELKPVASIKGIN